MLKKIILILIALSLFNCSTNKKNDTTEVQAEEYVEDVNNIEEKVKLVILGYGNENTPEGNVFITNVEKFIEANPDIDVVWDLLEDEVFHNKLRAMLLAEDELDLYYGWKAGNRFKKIIEAGQELDQRPYIDLEKYDSVAVGGLGSNGELWTVPISKNAYTVMYSNDDLLNELGLEVAETYEELLEQKEIAEAKGYRIMSYAGGAPWCHNVFLYSLFIGRYGGVEYVQDLIAGNAKFTDEPSIKTFDFIKKMQTDGVIDDISLNSQYGDSLAQFSNGRVLYYLDGYWQADQIDAFNFSWNIFPSIPGEVEPNTTNGDSSVGWAITKQASMDQEKIVAAEKFLRFITGEEASLQRAKILGTIPTVKIEREIEYRLGTEKLPSYIDSLNAVTDTVGDLIDGETNYYYSEGIISMWLDYLTPMELAEKTQEIFEKK